MEDLSISELIRLKVLMQKEAYESLVKSKDTFWSDEVRKVFHDDYCMYFSIYKKVKARLGC